MAKAKKEFYDLLASLPDKVGDNDYTSAKRRLKDIYKNVRAPEIIHVEKVVREIRNDNQAELDRLQQEVKRVAASVEEKWRAKMEEK